jgi:hypothetical protein
MTRVVAINAFVSIVAAAASVYEAAWAGNTDRGILLVLVSMVALLTAAVDTLSARPPVRVVRTRADLIPVERTVTGPDGATYALTGCKYAPVASSRVAWIVPKRRRKSTAKTAKRRKR